MSNYLEVDSSILENNFLVCDTSLKANDPIENLFKPNDNKYIDDTPWKLASPVPGCCLKTTNDEGSKVFINICQLDEIPLPKDITEEELLKLWNSEDASDYKIPLSLQDPHEELDNSGNPALVYDVAINTKFFTKIQNNQIFRFFFIQVALEGLENKYNITLEKEKYVILKNRKCLGNLKPHRIRIKKAESIPKCLIEEVSGSKKNLVPLKHAITKEEKLLKQLKFRFFVNSHKIVIGEIYIPLIAPPREMVLCMNEDRIILESKKKELLLDLFIPIKINSDNVKAFFFNETKILSIFMPVVELI